MSGHTLRPVAGEVSRTPYGGLWAEWLDYTKTSASGPKNTAKVVYHTADWFKRYTDYSQTVFSPEVRIAGETAREFKLLFGFLDFPAAVDGLYKKIKAFMHGPQTLRQGNKEVLRGGAPVYTTSRVEQGVQVVVGATGVFAPFEDTLKILRARQVVQVSSESIKVLGNWVAVALLVSMVYGIYEDLGRIWNVMQLENVRILGYTTEQWENWVRDLFGLGMVQEEPIYDDRITLGRQQAFMNRVQMIYELNLLDIAWRVSYVALATISLVSTFIVTVPHLSFWILVTSTSALAFTLIAEFRGRYYRTLNPSYPKLPDCIERRESVISAELVEREKRDVRLAHRPNGVSPHPAPAQPDTFSPEAAAAVLNAVQQTATAAEQAVAAAVAIQATAARVPPSAPILADE